MTHSAAFTSDEIKNLANFQVAERMRKKRIKRTVTKYTKRRKGREKMSRHR